MQKNTILLGLFVLFLSMNVSAQRVDLERLADRNESLENLVLSYKEKLQKANNDIKRLTSENKTLKRNIDVIMRKDNKSYEDISVLQRERQQLLSNKKALEYTIKERENTIQYLQELNKKLKNDNAMLMAANSLLEEAVETSDTIQKYQNQTISQQKENIERLIYDYSQSCSEVTAQYKVPFSKNYLEVVMEDSDITPNNKLIENLSVKVCYQMQDENASDRIIVYFTLFEGNSKKALRKVPFSINKVESRNGIIYYNGKFLLPATGKYQLSELESYNYEITYREQTIAKGLFKAS